MNIVLAVARGREQPSTLQWELTIPVDQLSLIDNNPEAGPEAKTAGKSVACSVQKKSDASQTSVCLVYGGREAIHDGVIATLHLKIADEAKPGSARILIDQAFAVTKDLKRTPMPAAGGAVTIRKKIKRAVA